MVLGRVAGTVWGQKQVMGLAGVKLCVVRSLDGREEVVAADRVGANPGEVVLVATGSRVRDIVYDGGVPVKSVVVAIVDGVAP